MQKTKTFRDLKVNDTVFVVFTGTRYGSVDRAQNMKVVKVGRKYAYIQRYSSQLSAFDLETGRSVHRDGGGPTMNGPRFSVYLQEDEYRTKIRNEAERDRLRKRLQNNGYGIIDLSPMTVACLHEVLDGAGIDSLSQ